MLKHVLRAGFACALMALVVFTGGSCDKSGNASTTSTKAGTPGAFTFINRGDIITLDLNQMSYIQDFRIMYALREGLYTYDPNTAFFDPIPALAKDTAISADKRVWTFTLRDNAKWTNGDPVTAGDFAFSWKLMLQSPGEYTYLFYYIKNAKAYAEAYEAGKPVSDDELGIKVIDAKTLQVTLDEPVPFLTDLLAFPPYYPRHAKSMEPFKVSTNGKVSYDAKYTLPENVVTNGPFVFKKWEQHKRLVLEKDPGYWDAANVKLNRIEMVVNDDPQSTYVQFKNGKVDWVADVAADSAAKLKAENNPDLHVAPAYGTGFLTLNCAEKIAELGDAKNPLSDLRVRKALAMSIDKQYIVDKITRMGETPAASYVPPGYFKDYVSTPVPGYNLSEAKKLLAEAGYPDGKGFPTLTISYNSENTTRKSIAEFLTQAWARDLGVKIEVRPLEQQTYKREVHEKRYTLATVSWYGDYMDLSTWTDKYLSNSLNNDSNWGPPQYDALCAQAAKEPDEVKRRDLLQKAETMINTDLPIIPMYYYVNVTLHRENVKGLVPNAKNLVVWKNVSVE